MSKLSHPDIPKNSLIWYHFKVEKEDKSKIP